MAKAQKTATPPKPATPPKIPHISQMLHPTRLDALRAGYSDKALNELFDAVLPNLYKPSKKYIETILDAFDHNRPSDASPTRKALSPPDRERCIVALLASRGETFTLAMHIYTGLMVGLTPQEIANILMLTGVYAGVSTFTDGLLILGKTLGELQKSTTGSSPQEVFQALKTAFGA